MGYLVVAVCLALGLLVLAASLAGLRRRNRILNEWVKLDNAVVLNTRVETDGRRAYPLVVYEYHSGDRYYLGEANPWWSLTGSPRQAANAAAQFREGDVISIYVNPDDHQMSVLEPAPPLWACGAGMAFAALCLAGAAMAVAYLRSPP